MSVGARRALWGLAAGPTAAPSFWAQAWVPWVVAASITASSRVTRRRRSITTRAFTTQAGRENGPPSLWSTKEDRFFSDFIESRPWHHVDSFYERIINGDQTAWDTGIIPESELKLEWSGGGRQAQKHPKAAFYALGIAYNGSACEAFAMNRKLDTIVGRIRIHLKNLLGITPNIVVSGRTDRGVHSTGQVVSFKTSASKAVDIEALEQAINAENEGVIRVWDVIRVPRRTFSAWSDATWREYVYLLPLTSKEQDRADQIAEKAHKLLKPLQGKELSYDAYCRGVNMDYNRSFCTITQTEASIAYISQSTPVLRIRIRGNRFLRSMVRILVSTTYWVACDMPSVWTNTTHVGSYGTRKPHWNDPTGWVPMEVLDAAENREDMLLYQITKTSSRWLTAPKAPARGLCLVKVGFNSSSPTA